MVLLGNLKLDDEQRLIGEMKQFLSERITAVPAYASYLKQWGDWVSPWQVNDQ